MRVTDVDMYSAKFEEPITFSLAKNDPSAQYMVRTILGLDAEEIVPKFYGRGLQTAPKYYDFGMKARDIVIRVILNPNFRIDDTYSNIRDDLYRSISADRTGKVVLHFRAGATLVSRIFGFITKFEVPYFVKLPEVQITVRCDDPMFRAINPVHFTPAELPTTNPINIPDSISTAPHGFTMQVTFKAASPSLTIQDKSSNPEWIFKVTPSGGFLINDVLYFSSEFSNKYLYIVRGGSTIQLIDKIQPNSIWPIIFPGQNSFYISEIATINWNYLEYYAAYWGV
jgi:hypothetical protein